MENGDSVASRNGNTKEVLNFKTEITNPYLRCVGGFGRDMNIFFLLAEALWIFAGRKDVAYLKVFNEKMGDYSDDGISFHAPYGFRLRHWGTYSFDKVTEENKHIKDGEDQLRLAIRMLSMNPDDRRVVMSIWNPDFDLASTSKDLPCNDLVMFKIRNNKLHTTISNRSNDLHWGLPTNVFQFGTLSELVALTLDIKLGTQVHNSQSLHYYLENDIAWKLYENYQLCQNDEQRKEQDLYSVCKSYLPIKFTFIDNPTPIQKLDQLDVVINKIIDKSIKPYDEEFGDYLFIQSKYFFVVYGLLVIYNDYKSTGPTELARKYALGRIMVLGQKAGAPYCDLITMAKNFFLKRIKSMGETLPIEGYQEQVNFDKRLGKL